MSVTSRSTMKRVAAATAGVAIAITAAGCGTAKESGGGSSGNELTLWTHNAGNPEELAVVQQIVKDYNASQQKYQVKVQAFPQESYNSSVVAAATSKKLPCLLDTDAPNVPNWAFANYLRPLDLPASLTDKQLKSTLGTYKNKLYAIGYYDAALAIFARKSAITSVGGRVPTIEKPWTAEEFKTTLTKLKAAGKYPIAFDLGTGDSGTEWWSYGYSPFLQSFGGDMINRETFKTAKGALNGPEAIAWGQWLQGLVKGGYSPAKSGPDAFADFVNGKSAMVWSGIWNSGNLSKLGADGVMLPPPDLGKGPKIGGGSWQWAISATCDKPEAALDYLKFSLDKKYLVAMAQKQNVIPATEEAAAALPDWAPGGAKRFFLEESKKFATMRPATPGYPYLTSTFAKATQDIVAGGDVKAILDQAAADIDSNLSSNNYYGF
ncbi:sugar ABC transporter substrate-binding protein [Arsenicicoccus piscis]|nr:sugar ABC transporter substrate-binding protein [Arsenicicoccus piscis]MCH8627046.1 sugar ABC transporter substrate-binding protein [Arsenicicoccus piscis]